MKVVIHFYREQDVRRIIARQSKWKLVDPDDLEANFRVVGVWGPFEDKEAALAFSQRRADFASWVRRDGGNPLPPLVVVRDLLDIDDVTDNEKNRVWEDDGGVVAFTGDPGGLSTPQAEFLAERVSGLLDDFRDVHSNASLQDAAAYVAEVLASMLPFKGVSP